MIHPSKALLGFRDKKRNSMFLNRIRFRELPHVKSTTEEKSLIAYTIYKTVRQMGSLK
ncbi:MAG TPA: hypothetical protein VFU79_05960 [Nitrososphaeraceae archaeon]|nr:hypothetical protein [Nitrososphaeraceae archaeon]